MRDVFWDLVVGGRCVGCGRPGRAVCASCDSTLTRCRAFSAAPTPPPPGMVAAVAASPYDGLVRRMVLAHKEQQAFGLARPLGALLALALDAALADWPDGAKVLLVPVPSRAAVVRARGHDPLSRIVTAAVRARRRVPRIQVARLLSTRGPVADQSGLGAAERARNLAGAFVVRERELRRQARDRAPLAAVICDDVLTTGSTVREAQRALEAAGVPVAAVVVVAATRLRRPRPLAGVPQVPR